MFVLAQQAPDSSSFDGDGHGDCTDPGMGTRIRAMTDRLADLAQKYGPLAMIAMFLVWYLASDISGKLERQTIALSEVARAMAAHQAETNFYMRALCFNAADTPQKIANCQDPRR